MHTQDTKLLLKVNILHILLYIEKVRLGEFWRHAVRIQCVLKHTSPLSISVNFFLCCSECGVRGFTIPSFISRKKKRSTDSSLPPLDFDELEYDFDLVGGHEAEINSWPWMV